MNVFSPERLRKCRQDKGLTQQKLTEKAGLPEGVISHWERGDNDPSLFNVCLLATALEVSVDYLCCRTDRKEVFK